MFDRIRLVAEPVGRMGKSVDSLVRDYNTMLSSIESRLIPAANKMQSLGGAQRAKDLPELSPVEHLTNQLNEGKWGVPAENVLFVEASEILELDEFEDE